MDCKFNTELENLIIECLKCLQIFNYYAGKDFNRYLNQIKENLGFWYSLDCFTTEFLNADKETVLQYFKKKNFKRKIFNVMISCYLNEREQDLKTFAKYHLNKD